MQVKDASKQRWQELELHRESAVGFMHINWELKGLSLNSSVKYTPGV